MAKVILGNHMAVFAARSEQERIRGFYCGVLGSKSRVQNEQVDRYQLGDVHFFFVWQSAVLDESHFLKAVYLELKTDNTGEMIRKILAFGVKKLENMGDGALYFQAPGGQVFKLVDINADSAEHEASPDVNPGATLPPS